MYFKVIKKRKAQKLRIEKFKTQTMVNIKAVRMIQRLSKRFLARKRADFRRLSTIADNEGK